MHQRASSTLHSCSRWYRLPFTSDLYAAGISGCPLCFSALFGFRVSSPRLDLKIPSPVRQIYILFFIFLAELLHGSRCSALSSIQCMFPPTKTVFWYGPWWWSWTPVGLNMLFNEDLHLNEKVVLLTLILVPPIRACEKSWFWGSVQRKLMFSISDRDGRNGTLIEVVYPNGKSLGCSWYRLRWL